ncbi:MAG: hypothetical protein FJ137_14955 [Deltaproteobacteria bacterium]|nr:hypothetical protein [Deltaproteobacteria bacterium]
MPRFLGFVAGPYSLAAPIGDVRQIVAVGADAHAEPEDARAQATTSLATLLGAAPRGAAQAVLAFDHGDITVRVSCCALRGVLDAAAPTPLPSTAARRHTGLVVGAIDDGDGLTLVVDARVLATLAAGGGGP